MCKLAPHLFAYVNESCLQMCSRILTGHEHKSSHWPIADLHWAEWAIDLYWMSTGRNGLSCLPCCSKFSKSLSHIGLHEMLLISFIPVIFTQIWFFVKTFMTWWQIYYVKSEHRLLTCLSGAKTKINTLTVNHNRKLYIYLNNISLAFRSFC